MTMPRTIHPCLCLLCCVLIALLLVACGETDPAGEGTADRSMGDREVGTNEPAGATADTPPADWTMPVLDAEAFTKLRQETAANGQVLVVDCWASWCGSCKVMFPKLHAAMKVRGDKVRLISITIDENADDSDPYLADARAYLIQQKAWEDGYLAVAGSDEKGKLAKSASAVWGGGAVPAVFVYGTDGELVLDWVTPAGTPEHWVKTISAAVDQAAE